MKNINITVRVGLEEAIDHDLEGFLDLLSELVNAEFEEEERGLLSDIGYQAVGFQDGLILIQVTGELLEY